MMIRSATALRNDYDGMVKLSTEKQEPILSLIHISEPTRPY